VRRLLEPDEELHDVAYMWHRGALVLPFAIVAGFVVGAIALLSGFGAPASVAIALAALAVAATAATDYRVLAVTDRGLVSMNGGRIRQVAKPPIERLPPATTVERVSNNLVISEWRVGDRRYSVLRRFESTMAAIATMSQR
jgi:hypothetical protein